MSEFQEFLNEQLQADEFRKEWEDIQPKMDMIRAMVDARISQNFTQKKLAERTEINQADTEHGSGYGENDKIYSKDFCSY